MLHVPGHNDSRWNGEQVMVSDLFFMSETFLSFRSRCSSVSLAETTVQGFSGFGEAKSSMHSGEVPGDELTHLDEVANSNCMN